MTLSAASSHKSRVVRRFARHAASYERHARLQRGIAGKLARHLPDLLAPRVLEIGCGTGFLTRHLIERYPDAALLVTDIAPQMLEACRGNVAAHSNVSFAELDGEAPAELAPVDLIVSSMVLQWFDDPAAGLARLRAKLLPGGELLYAVSGPEFLAEWSDLMRELGFALMPPATDAFPGVFEEERVAVEYGSARTLLAELRGAGATEPLGPGKVLTPARLRQAVDAFDKRGGKATWHVLYGRLSAA